MLPSLLILFNTWMELNTNIGIYATYGLLLRLADA